MKKLSFSLSLKIDKERPRKDGSAGIFFQVLINRRKERIGLGISWPVEKFSENTGCLARMKNDVDADAYNVLIENVRTKANEIKRKHLITGVPLTLDTFKKEFFSDLNKNDFLDYFEKKSFYRWNKQIISDHTYRLEKTVLGKLRRFVKQIYNRDQVLFMEFDYAWGPTFDRWLRDKDKLSPNSRWGTHKIVITYLNTASDIDKIVFDNPYTRFSNKTAEGSWGPLTADDLAKLTKFYNDWKANPLPALKRENGKTKIDTREGLTAAEVIVLRKFLFACNSALRVSDMQKLDVSLFNDGKMSITPHKTETYGTRIKDIPLSDMAKMLLADEIEFIKQQQSDTPYLKIQRMKDTSRIFQAYVDQVCNRILKRIALKTKLDLKLHMHVGRFTYGSLMDEAGANHTALMKQMGIRKRETLNKYVKTNAKRIEENVEKFNRLVSTASSLD